MKESVLSFEEKTTHLVYPLQLADKY